MGGIHLHIYGISPMRIYCNHATSETRQYDKELVFRVLVIAKSIAVILYLEYQYCDQGRSQGEWGKSPPPETEKIVLEKWCYFLRLY